MGKRILVLGGDKRMIAVSNAFCRDGAEVSAYGFSTRTNFYDMVNMPLSIEEATADADVIVTGLPMSADGVALSAPLWDDTIYISDLLPLIDKGKLLLGGKISVALREELTSRSIPFADYLDREELAVANAVPTAEGAIAVAMDAIPVTLWRSKILVIGFGRIGKVLAHRLQGLGASVSVSARKFYDLSWIDAYGYRSVTYDKFRDCLGEFDVIFNTVPKPMLGEAELDAVRGDCVIIELASAPGGVDTHKAYERGIRVISALALPGKCAPYTAGEIIERTILNILSETGDLIK